MSQNTVHQVASYLNTFRKPNPVGYSTSDFTSDVYSVLPKSAKRKIRDTKKELGKKASGLVESGQDKVVSLVDRGIDYKEPAAQGVQSQVASEGAGVTESEIQAIVQAQEDAEAQKAKDEEQASNEKARNIAIASVATIGGLVAIYLIFKR
jgi:hypothetical protein